MALTIVVRSGDSDSPPSITFDAPRIVIGRGESCEVRLPDPSVSHRHASIRQRGSDYLVVDEGSTNGTFVHTDRGEEIFVRRDSTTLTGEGVIGLGRAAQPGTALGVHFVVEE